ncbi:MAG TPA: GDP-mannose 4,6-dehydratase, partial [Micromonosporaceae bacterium]|nr:GDP-mannose 4,6-dehydratase [Micromonosporaceae bacterium]
MTKVLVTGSAGFIGGYLVEELLGRGYDVVGLDDYSKYGPVAHGYDDHPRFRFVEGDARDPKLVA